MPLNKYFNNYSAKYNEERLMENLIVEAIKITGIEAFYIPMDNIVARDILFGEDPLKKFTAAYPIEIFPETNTQYGGQTEMYAKFGLEIRNNFTILLSRRTYNQRVSNGSVNDRPMEGALIYIPVLNGQGELFEIKFVNQNKDMAILGRQNPYYYEIELEKFKYSHEVIATGIPDIDIVQSDEAYSEFYIVTTPTTAFNVGELVFQSTDNTYINSYAHGTVSEYNYSTHEIDVMNITGNLSLGNTLIGFSSNAHATLTSTQEFIQAQNHIEYDNQVIETEADKFIVNTGSNPFSSI